MDLAYRHVMDAKFDGWHGDSAATFPVSAMGVLGTEAREARKPDKYGT